MSIGDRQEPLEANDGNPSSIPPVLPSASSGGWSEWISPPGPGTGLLLLIIASLAVVIWNMNSKVTRLETQLASIPKVNETRIRRDITGIVHRIAALEAEKISMVAADNTHTERVADNATEITSLQNNLASLDHRMIAVETTNDKQSRDIAGLQRKTKAICESIATVRARLAKQLAATTNSAAAASAKKTSPDCFPCQFWPR